MRRLAILSLVLALGSAAEAQTVYNPRAVEFESPDHPTELSPGVPWIESYRMEFWLPGGTAPVQTFTLPRSAVTPKAGTTPQVYTALLTSLLPLPSMPTGTTYVAKLRSIGAAGSGESEASPASNPFAYLGALRSPAAVSVR